MGSESSDFQSSSSHLVEEKTEDCRKGTCGSPPSWRQRREENLTFLGPGPGSPAPCHTPGSQAFSGVRGQQKSDKPWLYSPGWQQPLSLHKAPMLASAQPDAPRLYLLQMDLLQALAWH